MARQRDFLGENLLSERRKHPKKREDVHMVNDGIVRPDRFSPKYIRSWQDVVETGRGKTHKLVAVHNTTGLIAVESMVD